MSVRGNLQGPKVGQFNQMLLTSASLHTKNNKGEKAAIRPGWDPSGLLLQPLRPAEDAGEAGRPAARVRAEFCTQGLKNWVTHG